MGFLLVIYQISRGKYCIWSFYWLYVKFLEGNINGIKRVIFFSALLRSVNPLVILLMDSLKDQKSLKRVLPIKIVPMNWEYKYRQKILSANIKILVLWSCFDLTTRVVGLTCYLGSTHVIFLSFFIFNFNFVVQH